MDSPFGLFKKKEESKELERKEMEDLNQLKTMEAPEELPPLPESEIAPPEVPKEEEKVPEVKEEKVELPEVSEEIQPAPVEIEKEVTFDELPWKELCNRIEEELKSIRSSLRGIDKITQLTLDSPELVDLLDLYVASKNKFQSFIDEINRMDLSRLSSKKSMAAIYKFRACKTLADMKKQIRKIDSICKKAGFIPTKIHEIIQAKAEDLVNSFLRESKKTVEKKVSRGKKKK